MSLVGTRPPTVDEWEQYEPHHSATFINKPFYHYIYNENSISSSHNEANHECAIVVTYNRKECLKKQIYNILEKQEFTPDAYYIIDNNSVDGTNELIDSFCEYSTNCKIIYVQLKENIGGAGGFYTGLKKAYEDGYDWYILMDDDGMPKNEKCFSEIINKIQDNGWDSENKYLINSLVVSDDTWKRNIKIRQTVILLLLIILSVGSGKIDIKLMSYICQFGLWFYIGILFEKYRIFFEKN